MKLNLIMNIEIEKDIEIIDITKRFFYEADADFYVDYEEAFKRVYNYLSEELDLNKTMEEELKLDIEKHLKDYCENWTAELDETDIIKVLYECFMPEARTQILAEAEEYWEEEINEIGLERAFAKADPEGWAAYEKEMQEEIELCTRIYKEVETLNLSKQEKEELVDKRIREALGIEEYKESPEEIVRREQISRTIEEIQTKVLEEYSSLNLPYDISDEEDERIYLSILKKHTDAASEAERQSKRTFSGFYF